MSRPFLPASIPLLILFALPDSSLPAACRGKTVANSADEVKVIVPFAVPVGVPVATFAPYFYSTQTFPAPTTFAAYSTNNSPPAGNQPPAVVNSSAASPGQSAVGTVAPDSVGHAVEPRSGNSSVIATRCATCHGGAAPKAGFSLQLIENLTVGDRLNAIRAVVSGRMPKGGHLTGDELHAAVEELSSLPPSEAETKSISNPPAPPAHE